MLLYAGEVARLIPRRFPYSRARERCIKEWWGARGEEEATNREYSVFKRRRGWAFYESRVRAVAIAVLMLCNSSRLFTVINKGENWLELAERAERTVRPSVRPYVRLPRKADEIAIGFSVL